ncbi:hypothetical protein GF342_03025 [Candidatus Woesearchaeota archaeon]|nr:hypothetical protein [Candidatus Woesearchaeota archaeon]
MADSFMITSADPRLAHPLEVLNGDLNGFFEAMARASSDPYTVDGRWADTDAGDEPVSSLDVIRYRIRHAGSHIVPAMALHREAEPLFRKIDELGAAQSWNELCTAAEHALGIGMDYHALVRRHRQARPETYKGKTVLPFLRFPSYHCLFNEAESANGMNIRLRQLNDTIARSRQQALVEEPTYRWQPMTEHRDHYAQNNRIVKRGIEKLRLLID